LPLILVRFDFDLLFSCINIDFRYYLSLDNLNDGVKMNKSDLAKFLAEREDISIRQSEEFLNLMFDSFIDALLKDERIEIRGFGSFSIREYESYEGRNPKTGEKITIPGKKLPFFKAGKDLTTKLNR